MKKKWFLILTWVLIILLMAGCAQPTEEMHIVTEPTYATETISPEETEADVKTETPKLVALYAGGTTDAMGLQYEVEVEYWAVPDKAENIPQTMTVTFGGKEYTGTYQYTIPRMPLTNRLYSYKYDGGTFGVLLENNRVVTFTQRYSTGTLSLEECEKIAEKIAGQYADITEYDLRAWQEGELCAFEYYRAINGIKTSDYVYIVISTGGDLYAVGLGTQDAFSTENTRAEAVQQSMEVLSSEAAETALQEKLDAIYRPVIQEKYPDAKITFRPSSQFWNQYWVKLPDGSVGLLYDGQIDMLIQHGEKTAYQSDLFRILVKCE